MVLWMISTPKINTPHFLPLASLVLSQEERLILYPRIVAHFWFFSSELSRLRRLLPQTRLPASSIIVSFRFSGRFLLPTLSPNLSLFCAFLMHRKSVSGRIYLKLMSLNRIFGHSAVAPAGKPQNCLHLFLLVRL